jgi:Holliday junction resolvase RusA-like endonuclease
MSPIISFFASGEPKGQPRPRAFARRMGGKFVARVFDAGTAEGWKAQIASAAVPHRPLAAIHGPVRISLTFVFPRPKKHYRANNPAKGMRDDAPRYHTGKPDNDNLQKAVMDALTQLGGFWSDDSQVAYVTSRKTYGDAPGCMVTIRELEQNEAEFAHGNAA